MKKKKKNGINISRYVLQFICFPVWDMPSSGVLVAHVYVSRPLFAIALFSVLSFV